MAVTYDYTIAKIYRNDDGGVVNIALLVTGEDENNKTAGRVASLDFTPDPSADGYTAFDDLTEAQVNAWAEAHDGFAKAKQKIADDLTEKASKGTEGFPWG